MKKAELDAWAQSRQKGKWKFILFNGVLAWGMPMYIIMTFVVGDGWNSEQFARRALVGAIIWPLAGLAFGAGLWFYNERRFTKAMSDKPAEHDQSV
jgi:hypothetical protein